MAVTDIYHVAGDLRDARFAVNHLGGNTDDYVSVNNAAIALVADGAAVGTWTAWVMIRNITDTTTVIGAGDDNAVEFIDLGIEAGLLTARCTDATDVQWIGQADNIEFEAHRWYHIAVVQAGKGPVLYVNGKAIAMTLDDTTDLPAWFDQTAGLDTMRIGAANKAGNASVTNEFGGAISDVKLWNINLSADDIFQEFEGGATNAANLQNHWTFKDDLIDDGLGNDPGNIVGSSILVAYWSEFSSRLAFSTGTPVVADTVQCFAHGNVGHAVVILAA